jgi:tyrosinase
MLGMYEKALHDLCDYDGMQPYWDWTRDADTGDITHSPIFHPVWGFGGNGEYIPGWSGPFVNQTGPGTGGGCLVDGPWKGFNLTVGPGSIPTNHCLNRAINNNSIAIMTTTQVLNTTKQVTFEDFRFEIGGAFRPPPRKLHDGGHGGINGEMGNVFSSPGDPLFYLHHGGIDRVWAMWQDMDKPKRLREVSGNTVYNTTNSPELTLDFVLKMLNVAPSYPVRDVMNTRGNLLCYEYV